ncbi:hypothetical protein [Metamycoplasma hominis]
MKKSKKFLIALSSSLIISAATIPASIYCIIKNKNSWIQKYNNSRESAEKLINLINKNEHYYYFAIQQKNDLQNFLIKNNLTTKNSTKQFMDSFYKINSMNSKLNNDIYIKNIEFYEYAEKICASVKQLKSLHSKLINIKANNNIEQDLDSLISKCEISINKNKNIDNSLNLNDLKERYSEISAAIKNVSNSLGQYENTISKKITEYKENISKIENIKNSYFSHIDNGEEYYKLFKDEIESFKKDFKKIQSIKSYDEYSKETDAKINYLKQEIKEHARLSKEIKENGENKVNKDSGEDTFLELRNSKFKEPKSFLLLWSAFSKLYKMPKEKFINLKPAQIKQFFKEYEERKEAFYRINEMALVLERTWQIYIHKVRILEHFYFKSPETNKDYLFFEYNDETISKEFKDIETELLSYQKQKQDKLDKYLYSFTINHDTENIDEEKLMKSNDYYFNPEEDMMYLHYHFGQLLDQKINSVFEYYNKKAKALLQKIQNNANYSKQKEKLQKLLSKNISYRLILSGETNRENIYYNWQFYKVKKDNEDNIVPIKKFPEFYEKEIFTSQYIHELDDILSELKDVQ